MDKKNTASEENILSRRELLTKGMYVGGGALIMSGFSNVASAEPLEVPQWSKQVGKPILTNPYGLPSKYEKDVIRHANVPEDSPPGYVPALAQNSWSATPLADMRGIITPNGLFYERHHGGIADIDPTQHRLIINGMVERNLEISVANLKRYPSINRINFLECSGNSDKDWQVPTGSSVQSIHGLLSCAQWTGVSLGLLLREAGADLSKAKYIIAEGADAPSMSRTLPIDRALDDVIVAYAQNGESLRPEQGYPLRLFVPGCEGNLNVKWLRRLEVTDTPLFSRNETSKYTDLLGNNISRAASLTMEAKSVITTPSAGQTLPEKGFYEIRGFAWSGNGKIARVDISLDGGKNWQPAHLNGPVLSKCLTEFTLPWRWKGQHAVILSRAVDETGYVQPYYQQIIKARGHHSEYHNNSMQAWEINTDGSVHNARV